MKVDIDTSDKLYADAWLGFKGTDWKNGDAANLLI